MNHSQPTAASCTLQKRVRDPRAGYFQSLDVLKAAKECGVYTKSSIMLGLGETDDEIVDTMYDLKDAVCNFLHLHHDWQKRSHDIGHC